MVLGQGSLCPLAVLCLLLSACATKIYQGPTSGRGAEQQQAVALSAERAFAEFDAAPFRGKRVVLEAYGLTERLEGESPEEGFCRSLLRQKLLDAGAVVVPRREDAEILLTMSLRTVGVDVIRRDAPLIYHHTTFRGLTSVRISAAALDGRTATRRLSSELFEAESLYREVYIFYVFGPIPSRSTTLLTPAPPED